MTSKTSNRSAEWSRLIKGIADFYRRDIYTLINMLREKNVSDEQIAKTLKFDAAIITRRYPRVKKEESNESK